MLSRNVSANARANGVDERLAYSVGEAAQTIGLGKSTLYREMDQGRLPFRKVGKRRLILRSDLLAWVSGNAEAA